MNYLQPIESTVTQWDNISAAPHRYNAREFNLSLKNKTVEIGHIHSGRMLDILFSKKLREVLVAEARTEVHHILPETGWTTTHIRTESDVENALWLLRLSYLQKAQKVMDKDVLQQELTALNISETVREAAFHS